MLSRDVFKEGFTGLCEMYNKQPSEALVKMYYAALQKLSDEQFQGACIHIVTTRKYTTFPMPAEFIDHAFGDQEAAALRAFDNAIRAASVVGGYESVVFDDPIIHAILSRRHDGWTAFCAMKYEDLKWEEKEFVKLYKMYVSGAIPDYPKHLSGHHELGTASYREPTEVEPVFIGDKEKCAAIYAGADESCDALSGMAKALANKKSM